MIVVQVSYEKNKINDLVNKVILVGFVNGQGNGLDNKGTHSRFNLVKFLKLWSAISSSKLFFKESVVMF